MKKRLGSLVLALVCVLIMAVPVCAADVRASDQIKLYSMEVTPGDNTIDVEFSITGKGIMSKVGCQSIYVYEANGSGWSFVTSLYEDDAGMSRTNVGGHKNMISIDCEAGVEYKVVVTVFAENSAGRDARTQPFFLIG